MPSFLYVVVICIPLFLNSLYLDTQFRSACRRLGVKIAPVEKRRFQAVLRQQHVQLLGRTVDLRALLAERVNANLLRSLDIGLKTFEAGDLTGIMVSTRSLDLPVALNRRPLRLVLFVRYIHVGKGQGKLTVSTYYSYIVPRGRSRLSCRGCPLSLTLKVLVTAMDAQWEGMGDVGSARYEPALLPPCPTIRVLSYSN